MTTIPFDQLRTRLLSDPLVKKEYDMIFTFKDLKETCEEAIWQVMQWNLDPDDVSFYDTDGSELVERELAHDAYNILMGIVCENEAHDTDLITLSEKDSLIIREFQSKCRSN